MQMQMLREMKYNYGEAVPLFSLSLSLSLSLSTDRALRVLSPEEERLGFPYSQKDLSLKEKKNKTKQEESKFQISFFGLSSLLSDTIIL